MLIYSHHNNQRGIALYLALAILAILLAIALGVSSILFGQMKTITAIGHSVIAFYAADSGIEEELYRGNYDDPGKLGYTYAGFLDLDGDEGSVTSCPDGLADGDDACYQVTVDSISPAIIRSVGVYREVRRALEISF